MSEQTITLTITQTPPQTIGDIRQFIPIDGIKGNPGAPFTFDMFTPDQLSALKGAPGAPGVMGLISAYPDNATPLDTDLTIVEKAGTKTSVSLLGIYNFFKSKFDSYFVKQVVGSRLMTTAEGVIIANQAGSNTGDNAVNTLYSGLASSKENTGVASQLISDLKNGVVSAGDTLLKLYNLIVASYKEQTVANIAARDAYNIDHLPFNIFVLDDGDGKWALYKAITTGVGATFVKLSDPDLLNAVMSATQIQTAYEGISGVNRFTNAYKAQLDSITAVFTTLLKTAYDSTVAWITTNGVNILNHVGIVSGNPHGVVPANITGFNAASLAAAPAETATSIKTALGITTLSGSNTGDQPANNWTIEAVTGDSILTQGGVIVQRVVNTGAVIDSDITKNGLKGFGTNNPQRIVHIKGDTPFIRLENTHAGGKTAELFAGTLGVGFGSDITGSQFVLLSTAPAYARQLDANYVTLGVATGITSVNTLNLRGGGGVAGKGTNIDAYNGSAWQNLLSVASVASGIINLSLVTNGGRLLVNTTDDSTHKVQINGTTKSNAYTTLIQPLTYAASVTLNYLLGANASTTLTGNIALVLSNVADGGSGAIYLTQDTTGNRLLTGITHAGLTVKFKAADSTLTTTANATDIIYYERIGTLLLITLTKNF